MNRWSIIVVSVGGVVSVVSLEIVGCEQDSQPLAEFRSHRGVPLSFPGALMCGGE